MLNKRILVLFVTVSILSISSLVAAQNASVYVVHGIPGADLGAAASLPVDVSVNGSCALKNFQFGQIIGPVSLPPGKAEVKISLTGNNGDCAGTTAIGPASFNLKPGESATIIAHLTASGEPTARKFTNDDSRTNGGRARIAVHHTAAAPLVDVNISPKARINQVRNSERFSVEAAQGTAEVSIAASGSNNPAFGPISFEITKNARYLVFAVGSVANNTLTLLSKTY
jgi:hypothetical protein